MTPVDALPTPRPTEPAERAREVLSEGNLDHIPVLEGTRLQGVVRMRDLLRWIALQDRHPPPAG
jgi:CBS domain-containing protein